MPFFTARGQHAYGRADYPFFDRPLEVQRAERWEGPPAITQRETPQHRRAASHQPRQSQPVQIPPSSACQPSGTATRLLGDHAALIPIPSYETVQTGSPVNGDGAASPPTYDSKWERLPGYRAATDGGQAEPFNIGPTPSTYWVGLGDPRTMAPIAAGGGGMFFNSPFQHYRLVPESDVEHGNARAATTICGMSVGRADLVINLSLLALCTLIWSAVVLSLSFSEPRLSGQGAPTDLAPNSTFYGHPFLD
jgi:hypothetical protein